MLQYISWLWNNQTVQNMDNVVRMMAVSKIENAYLKYKSVSRKQTNELDMIKKDIASIVSIVKSECRDTQSKNHKYGKFPPKLTY